MRFVPPVPSASSLNPVLVSMDDATTVMLPVHELLSLQFTQHTLRLLSEVDAAELEGTTTWAATRGGRQWAFLSFAWARTPAGVLMSTDLSDIDTNLCLLGADAAPLSLGGQRLVLAAVVHGLDWQAAVCLELERMLSTATELTRCRNRHPLARWSTRWITAMGKPGPGSPCQPAADPGPDTVPGFQCVTALPAREVDWLVS